MDITTLETVLLSLLVADALTLTVLVLLQQGKGADAGASFGAGAANTVFGSSGSSSFLTKATSWLAIGFFVIAFGLAYVAKQRANTADSLGIPTVESVSAPAEPQELTAPEESVDFPVELAPSDDDAGDIPDL